MTGTSRSSSCRSGRHRLRARDQPRDVLRRLTDHAHPRAAGHQARQHVGLAARTVASAVIFTTSHHGLPVSTTHVTTGSITGVGPPAGCRPCAGASPARSRRRGCSPSRWPPWPPL
ncbi:inorganic phosphate transporter [Motilibacter sp. K478]|nr:inorganic phosphate transporter [Motilibacter aurantiacus]